MKSRSKAMMVKYGHGTKHHALPHFCDSRLFASRRVPVLALLLGVLATGLFAPNDAQARCYNQTTHDLGLGNQSPLIRTDAQVSGGANIGTYQPVSDDTIICDNDTTPVPAQPNTLLNPLNATTQIFAKSGPQGSLNGIPGYRPTQNVTVHLTDGFTTSSLAVLSFINISYASTVTIDEGATIRIAAGTTGYTWAVGLMHGGSATSITNDGTISTLGRNSVGISIGPVGMISTATVNTYVTNNGLVIPSADNIVVNSGTITTGGINAAGINVYNSARLSITNTGSITATGDSRPDGLTGANASATMAAGILINNSPPFTGPKPSDPAGTTVPGSPAPAIPGTNDIFDHPIDPNLYGRNPAGTSSGTILNEGGTISAKQGSGIEVRASDMVIVNRGVFRDTDNNPVTPDVFVEGVLSSTESAAVHFGKNTYGLAEGGNTLILQPGSVLNGDVVSESAGNILRLQGSGSEDSDLGVGMVGVGNGVAGTNNVMIPTPNVGIGFEQLTMGVTSGATLPSTAQSVDIPTLPTDLWTLSGTVTINGTAADAVWVNTGTLHITGDTITLNGGGTTVESGAQLRVDGTLGDGNNLSPVTVKLGATLSGEGTIFGSVAVADGGILSPHAGGNTGANELTINADLILNPLSILDYDFGATTPAGPEVGGPLNDHTIVKGDLTLDGTINVLTTPGGSFDPGVYRIITYDGNLTNNGLAIGTIPSPDYTVQTSVTGEVNLILASVPLTFWDGANTALHDNGIPNGGNGLWQDSTGNVNWMDGGVEHDPPILIPTPNAPWDDGAFAVFMGAPGTVRVDNSLDPVTVTGMQFASNGYFVVPNVAGEDLTLLPNGDGQSIIRVGAGGAGADYVATITANLIGNTQLAKRDLGTLVLTGINTYDGGTAIDDGRLRVSQDANLGIGDLSMGRTDTGINTNGTLNTTASFATARAITLNGLGGTFETNPGTTLELTGSITGAGSLTKTGTGTLLFNPAGAIDYTGDTFVNQGILRAGAAGVLSDASNHQINPAGTLDLAGFNQTVADLSNAGFINFGTNTPPVTTLTVTGNYTGNNGLIAINTQLGDDSSPTDKLVVTGDTAGTTRIRITNAGGAGALTTGNGIEIVQVDGNSDGVFTLANRVAIGAYEYGLFQGGLGADATNGEWYLRAASYRPETSLYNVLPSMLMGYSNTLLDTLHERIGDEYVGEPMDMDAQPVWGRILATKGHAQDGAAEYHHDTWTAQGGVDLYRNQKTDGSTHRLGAYAALGTMSADARHDGQDAGDNRLYGKTLGAYWTHFTATGAYVDVLAQYTWAKLSANPRRMRGFDTHGGIAALSLEVGKPFRMDDAQDSQSKRILEPQAQIIYQKGSMDSDQDQGAQVRFSDIDSTTLRLGARYADIQTQNAITTLFWVRPSLLHTFQNSPTTTFSSGASVTPFDFDQSGGSFELAAGVERQRGKDYSLFLSGLYRTGLDGDSYDYGLKAGIRWDF